MQSTTKRKGVDSRGIPLTKSLLQQYVHLLVSRASRRLAGGSVLLVLLYLLISTTSESVITSETQPLRAGYRQDAVAIPEAETNNYIHSQDWETPFSFSVSPVSSSEEVDIAVLPLLEERCPVYTFFDLSEFTKAGKDISLEASVLTVWKRAFWALGFKPIVLDVSHAQKNPRYVELEALPNMSPEARLEVLRFLAWSSMPTGVLTSSRIIPMTTWPTHSDLKFLRGCQFGPLTAYKDTLTSFMYGSQQYVNAFVAAAFQTGHRSNILGYALESLQLEDRSEHFAHYTDEYVARNCKGLELSQLPDLINAHLHSTFLSRFGGGIVVVDPFLESSHILTYPALSTAYAIASCPVVAFEDFCPPNRPKDCFKCSKQFSPTKKYIKFAPSIPDTTNELIFVTIPHPLLHLALTYGTPDVMDAELVRRTTTRDVLVRALTAEINVDEAMLGAPHRTLELKKMAVDNSMVLDNIIFSIFEAQFALNECAMAREVEFQVGFRFNPPEDVDGSSQQSVLDRAKDDSTRYLTSGRSSSTLAVTFEMLELELEHCLPLSDVKRLRKDAAHIPKTAPPTIAKDALPLEVADASSVITAVRRRVLGAGAAFLKERKMIEAWNMGDAEIWRFVSALNERAAQECHVWT
ncbi:uncharacterized protein V1518DRAFT_417942 [Limtongia smithiae]|uniref:uncharacterized protein n=1 Tax=Limtongia smithiae TaxID=1125753 RepID=UPI0034CFDD2E